mmetsp:Transcript_10592/g.21038  ORF Transcript_10592/g.21038 Transcript_10592/m.21038 type:complete len:291 (-) Transcript_10592:529-1401(-)
MMSAVKMVTLFASAYSRASSLMSTSNAKMVAYSGFFLSCINAARITSFLKMGPTETAATGMGGLHSFLKNTSRASRAPNVDATASTPSESVASAPAKLAKSATHSSLSSSTSPALSLLCTTSTGLPATAFSSPTAQILMPTAPFSLSLCTYWDLMRSSRFGGGVSSARTVVTNGPSVVHTTMVAPLSSSPLTRITSMVQPRPSMTFTSSTVHCRLGLKLSFFAKCCWLSLLSMCSRSLTPSPEIADVGTKLTVEPSSSFSQYSSALRPFSISCTRTPFMRWWNSSWVAGS